MSSTTAILSSSLVFMELPCTVPSSHLLASQERPVEVLLRHHEAAAAEHLVGERLPIQGDGSSGFSPNGIEGERVDEGTLARAAWTKDGKDMAGLDASADVPIDHFFDFLRGRGGEERRGQRGDTRNQRKPQVWQTSGLCQDFAQRQSKREQHLSVFLDFHGKRHVLELEHGVLVLAARVPKEGFAAAAFCRETGSC
eukprot:scaffold1254_cov251-Pinguiococcus_pyrenoidosus.AAC.21